MLIAIVLDRPLAEAKALVDDPAAFTREMPRILREKQSHPLIAQMMKPAESSNLPPAKAASSSVNIWYWTVVLLHDVLQNAGIRPLCTSIWYNSSLDDASNSAFDFGIH